MRVPLHPLRWLARPASLAAVMPVLAALGAFAGGSVAAPSPVEAAPVGVAGPAVVPLLDLPGPAPRARPAGVDVAAVNAACASCHVEIAAEWTSSMHRQAWVDPVFQAAYDIEPLPFCRSCHAPESDPAAAPLEAAKDVGVACTTCHVQEVGAAKSSVVVGTHGASPQSPHPVLADARLGTAQACGSCHQFDFPRVAGAPMQSTIDEHASSRFASTPCQGCHMPERTAPGGRRWKSHAFAVISDPAMIRSAATASASRTGSKSLSVELEPRGAGHSFPTGDMFRRLEVRAVAHDPSTGREVARAEPVHLGRKFGGRSPDPHAMSMERVEIEDTRLPPPGVGSRTIDLRFPISVRGAEVRWEVAYQRMSNAMAVSFGVDQARDEVIVVSGVLAPAPSPQVPGGAASSPRKEKDR